MPIMYKRKPANNLLKEHYYWDYRLKHLVMINVFTLIGIRKKALQ